MKTMADIYDLLKEYGTFIYTRDPLGDLALMEDESKELYKAQVLDIKDYQMALLLIRQRETKERSKMQQDDA